MFYLIGLSAFLTDRILKTIALSYVSSEGAVLIPKFFYFKFYKNFGAAFSLKIPVEIIVLLSLIVLLGVGYHAVLKLSATWYSSVDRGAPQRPRRNTKWRKVLNLFCHRVSRHMPAVCRKDQGGTLGGKKVNNKKLPQYVLLFLILGAASNIFDRIYYGYVIDYFSFFNYSFFNIADLMIIFSLGFVLYYYWKK